MITPRISVIIPTYQEEEFIGTLLDQFTHELRKRHGIEVIVSDGGSRDQTVAIARLRADRVLEAENNSKQNISIGRNRGARVARGDVLIFLDADVNIENAEQFFSIMGEVVLHEKTSAATCKVFVYPEEETVRDRYFHRFLNWYFWVLNAVGMGMARGECQVIRKDVFQKLSGYNESIAAGEDYELFLRLRRLGKVSYVRSLKVFESPRRYRRYGYFRTLLLWFLNAVFIVLFRRSLVDQWKPVR
ncbi:MAG: glycosyltransferase [Ignavibacteriae bacterium]|nr:glycosyltransferase [Ignavibacteriota bacterium]